MLSHKNQFCPCKTPAYAVEIWKFAGRGREQAAKGKGRTTAKTIKAAEGSVADFVAEQIKEAIRAGAILPGQKLPERALAAKWGVSPSPVREALASLEAVGLLERRGRGRSLFVKDIDEGEILEVMQARAVLEGFAAGEACEKLTAKQLNELERLCGEVERMQEAGQTLENEPLEIQFHNLILKTAGNRYIERLVEDARMTLYSSTLARLVSLIGVDRPRKNDPPNHYDIVESLRSRDPQRAEAVAREHVLAAMRRLLQDAKKAREILSLHPPAPRKEVLSHKL